MKYLVYLFVVIAFCSLTIKECEESNERERESDIREACQEEDFAKAYKLVNKEDNAHDRRNILYTFVATQEAIFLVSKHEYDRVKYLYQQTLAEVGNSRIYEFNQVIVTHAIIEDDSEFLLEFLPINNYYNNELENYFIKKKNRETNEYLFMAISRQIEDIDKHDKKYHALPSLNEKYDSHYELDYYHDYAREVNAYLNTKVSLALSAHNVELAKQLLDLFKKHISFERLEDYKYKVTKIFQSEDELEAIQKVQQALQSN